MRHRDYAINYAKALFNLKGSQEEQERRLKEFEDIAELLTNSPDFNELLNSRHIPLQKRKKVLEEVFKATTDKKIYHLLSILLEKNEISYIPKISKEYHLMVIESLGVERATIVSASPLEDKSKKALQDKIENFLGKKIEIKEKIDPRLIGGFIIVLANQMLDFSLKHRLINLEKDLLAK